MDKIVRNAGALFTAPRIHLRLGEDWGMKALSTHYGLNERPFAFIAARNALRAFGPIPCSAATSAQCHVARSRRWCTPAD